MFTNKGRVLVCFLLGMVAILAAYFVVYEIVAFCIVLIGLVIYGYFKEGTIIVAAKQYKKEEYQLAKELLESIKYPKYLSKKRKPYYEYLLGNIALHQMDYKKAEMHLANAAKIGLKARDLGSAIMQLANISLRENNKEKGLAWIAQAEKIPLSSRQKSILQNIEKELQKI